MAQGLERQEIAGRRIGYFDSGAPEGPSGPALLMVHGNPTGSFVYHRLIAELDGRFRVIAPDLLGFGTSEKPVAEADYSLAGHVGIVAELVARLDLEDVALIGHDWGGPIGVGAALRDRRRYRGLVLMNTLTEPMLRLPFGYRILARAAARSAGLRALLIRRLGLFQHFCLRGLDPHDRRVFARAHPGAAERAGIAAFPAMIPTSPKHPSYGVLREIYAGLAEWSLPVLVLFSDRDALFPARAGRALAGRLPRARFELVPGAGHFLQLERPASVARAIVRWLADAGA